jgi:hypothetical protein
MRSKLFTATAALASLMVTMAAHAGGGPGNNVPEPGTWALVGLAAAIGWFATRGKRK